tara:strand:+ start:1183 stop:1677 length:495 start_codon:yes stop_codon:yes gene_type:complete
MIKSNKICCPVCAMADMSCPSKYNFEGVNYFFCSSQCMNRFKAHPHLYVGTPQLGKSVKQRHEVVLKKRRIYLNEKIDDALEKALVESLQALMGVKEVSFNMQELFVSYDLLEVSLDVIEKNIEASAAKLRKTLLDTIKRELIHYSEDCELENLAHLSKDGGCH